jgi:NADH-quinone oxidoreductase subunit E
MSAHDLSHVDQPATFSFTDENRALADRIIAKYPEGKQRSALLPLLDLAQRQHGNWLPRAAMDYVGDLLETPHIKVYEVATFYTMFNLKPVGRNFIQICTTTPCWLRGSEGIVDACKKKLGIELGETTADGKFTVIEVECLGACVNAPMALIGDQYYEDLTPERIAEILDLLARGEHVPAGSQAGRRTSMAVTGSTTLKAQAGGVGVEYRGDE